MKVNSLATSIAASTTSSEYESSECPTGEPSYHLYFESSRLTTDQFIQSRRRLQHVQEELAQLEAEKDSLVFAVSDLRQLLRRVSEENVAQRKVGQMLNLACRNRASTLKATLALAEQECLHMDKTAAYWAEWGI